MIFLNWKFLPSTLLVWRKSLKIWFQEKCWTKKYLFDSTRIPEHSFYLYWLEINTERDWANAFCRFFFFPVRRYYIRIPCGSAKYNAFLIKPNSWYLLLPVHEFHNLITYYRKKNFLPSSSIVTLLFQMVSCSCIMKQSASLHLLHAFIYFKYIFSFKGQKFLMFLYSLCIKVILNVLHPSSLSSVDFL